MGLHTDSIGLFCWQFVCFVGKIATRKTLIQIFIHNINSGYEEYFNGALVENEAITYLTLANELIRQLEKKENTKYELYEYTR